MNEAFSPEETRIMAEALKIARQNLASAGMGEETLASLVRSIIDAAQHGERDAAKVAAAAVAKLRSASRS
jgi:hypothetical protein